MPPVAPPRAIGLEHLFETIENGSTAQPAAGSGALNWGQGDEPAAVAEPTVISIGQIDISVTPPAAREAPARTHGFEYYARMRRGLER